MAFVLGLREFEMNSSFNLLTHFAFDRVARMHFSGQELMLTAVPKFSLIVKMSQRGRIKGAEIG